MTLLYSGLVFCELKIMNQEDKSIFEDKKRDRKSWYITNRAIWNVMYCNCNF